MYIYMCVYIYMHLQRLVTLAIRANLFPALLFRLAGARHYHAAKLSAQSCVHGVFVCVCAFVCVCVCEREIARESKRVNTTPL